MLLRLSNIILPFKSFLVNEEDIEIMTNLEIKELMARKRLRQYEVAKAVGVSEFTFSRWLREELPDEKKKSILETIEKMEI